MLGGYQLIDMKGYDIDNPSQETMTIPDIYAKVASGKRLVLSGLKCGDYTINEVGGSSTPVSLEGLVAYHVAVPYVNPETQTTAVGEFIVWNDDTVYPPQD